MRALLLILLISTFLTSGTLVAEDSKLTFSAYYKLYSSGIEVGESRQSIKKIGNDQYQYISNSRTTGLARLITDKQVNELSRWLLSNNQIIPIEYKYEKLYSGELDRTVTSKFDWKNLKVENNIFDRDHKNKTQDLVLPLQAGMLDKLLYKYAISFDMQNGLKPGEYTIADTRKLKTYLFEDLGRETISTELGDLETVKLLRQMGDDDGKLVFWCSPDYQYLPVKIEITEEDGRVLTILIQSFDDIQKS